MSSGQYYVSHTDCAAPIISGGKRDVNTSYSIDDSESPSVDKSSTAASNVIEYDSSISADEVVKHKGLNNLIANRHRNDEMSIDLTLDQALIAVKTLYFGESSIEAVEYPVSDEYLSLIYFHFARGFRHQKETIDYIKTTPGLCTLIGVNKNINRSTLNRKIRQIKKEKESKLQKLKDAATLGAYAVIRSDILVSEDFLQAHNHPSPESVDLAGLDRKTEQEGICDLVQDYLDQVIVPSFTFNRADNKKYKIEQIIGALAFCALKNKSPDSAINVFDYEYDSTQFPTGNHIYNLIKSLARSRKQTDQATLSGSKTVDGYQHPTELMSQGEAAYQLALEFAISHGLLAKPRDLACDSTIFPSFGDYERGNSSDPRIDRGGWTTKSADTDSGWEFNIMSTIGRGPRLILSVQSVLYTTKDRSEMTIRQLNHLSQAPIETGTIYFDRGYYRVDILNELNQMEELNWVVGMKFKGHSKKLLSEAPPDRPTSHKYRVGAMEQKYNLLLYPLNNEFSEKLKTRSQKTLIEEFKHRRNRPPVKSTPNKKQSHIGLITNRELYDETMHEVFSMYRQRNEIENLNGQLKSQFVPKSQSSDPAVRLYCIIVGGLFYNLHQIINNTISSTGVDASPDADEVLQAIVSTVFDSNRKSGL